jgi:hypothetical protein
MPKQVLQYAIFSPLGKRPKLCPRDVRGRKITELSPFNPSQSFLYFLTTLVDGAKALCARFQNRKKHLLHSPNDDIASVR